MGFAAAQTTATLNGPMSLTSMPASSVFTLRSYCYNGGGNTFEQSYYISQSASPWYDTYYSSTNPNHIRRILDSSTIFVYNPGTFTTNGSFNFLSNVVPNGSNVYVTHITSPNTFVSNPA